MKIKEVNTRQDIREFHSLPFRIYKNDPHWVPHLKQEVEAVFDKSKNKFFRHGEINRWLLYGDNGEVIGRVAAFINRRECNSFKQPTGGMGFFECLDDQKAANQLFDTCKIWLQERGMEAMDGPVNFGENHKYWGLIIENFERPPYYGQNYNPEYYVKLFENYGFQIWYKQIIFHRYISTLLQDKFIEKAERLKSDPRYSVTKIDKRQLEKFAEDFRTVYNRAWGKRDADTFKGMKKEQAMALLRTLKPIIDEDLIHFAYYEDRPIGFYISLPELNEIFKYLKGDFSLWGKLKFLWYKKTKKVKTSFGLVFGIDPDFQGRGVEGLIFRNLRDHIQPTLKYEELIITWIGDFNPKMIAIIENLGTSRIRMMATYRKLFDENAVFERRPIVK